MKGYRKVIIAGGIVLAAVFAPLDEHKATVLCALAYATMGANSLEHLSETLVRHNGNRSDLGSSTGPEEPDVEG